MALDSRTAELIEQANTGGWTVDEIGYDPGCHVCDRFVDRYLMWYGGYECPPCYLASWGIEEVATP
jgi:hypothetical protein